MSGTCGHEHSAAAHSRPPGAHRQSQGHRAQWLDPSFRRRQRRAGPHAHQDPRTPNAPSPSTRCWRCPKPTWTANSTSSKATCSACCASPSRTWAPAASTRPGRRPSKGLRHAFRRLQQINTAARSRRNVQRHYDLSGELYRLFLDEDMQYSCAYFEQPDMTLDEAQLAKKRHIAAKLRLKPGQTVLDIGSRLGRPRPLPRQDVRSRRAGRDAVDRTARGRHRARACAKACENHVHFELRTIATSTSASTASSRSACSSMSASTTTAPSSTSARRC